MDNGWQKSANAWVADMGKSGDFGRRYVLDLVNAAARSRRFPQKSPRRRLRRGALLPHAQVARHRCRRPRSNARINRRRTDSRCQRHLPESTAERLPFLDATFDLVVSYLSLIDIPDVEAAVPEMARVLKPGGTLLIANLTSFNTACADVGWVKDALGRRVHYPIDNYLQERAMWDRIPVHSNPQRPSPLEHVSARTPQCGSGSDPFRRARSLCRRTGLPRGRLRSCAVVPGHGVAETAFLALSSNMKASVHRRYGPPDVVRIEDVPRPDPKTNELLVRYGRPLSARVIRGCGALVCHADLVR